MKRAIIIIFLFALLLPAYSQKTNKQTADKQTEVRIMDAGADFAKFSITKKNENTAIILMTYLDSTKTVSIKTQNELTNDEIELSKLQKLGRNQWLLCNTIKTKSPNLIIKGLNPQTDYYLNIYTKNKEDYSLSKIIAFNTLAPIPARQASQISIIEATDKSITLKWVNGTGIGRIVIMRKGAEPNKPENGKIYTASPTFGDAVAKIGESQVVYDGNEANAKITVGNLQAGKYFFQVFEYNGEGKYRAYNTDKASNNPRSKSTMLPAPKILAIENITSNSCEIKWTKVSGAVTYVMDVATDKAFMEKIELYNELDVGDLDGYAIVDLSPNRKYYVRLKAVGDGTQSNFSNSFDFETKGE